MSDYRHDDIDGSDGDPTAQGPASNQGHLPSSKDAPEPPTRWNPPAGQRFENQPSTGLQDMSPQSLQPYGWQAPADSHETIGKVTVRLSNDEVAQFAQARKLITIAQVCAIVSLFLGGVILSAVSVGIAWSGFRKLDALAQRRTNEPDVQQSLRRIGLWAIGMGALALVLNAVSLILIYPMFMQAMQTGDLGALFWGTPSSSTPNSGGSSVWG